MIRTDFAVNKKQIASSPLARLQHTFKSPCLLDLGDISHLLQTTINPRTDDKSVKFVADVIVLVSVHQQITSK